MNRPTTITGLIAPRDTSTPQGTAQWEGLAFGAIVLAAFLLYGIGSAYADRPVGLLLVALNSAAVTAAGLIGFRLMRFVVPRVGLGYFTVRTAEGILLGGGIILIEFADAPEAGNAALAAGAFLELVTGRAVATAFAIPGGLFELTLGILLLGRGFGQRR